MSETQFLSDLRSRLISQGVDTSDADKYAEQFKRYFDNLTKDEISEQIASLGSMEGIVSNLLTLIEAKRARAEMPEKNDGKAAPQESIGAVNAVSDDTAPALSPDSSSETEKVPAMEAQNSTVANESELYAEKKSEKVKSQNNTDGIRNFEDEFISESKDKEQDEENGEIAMDEEFSSLRSNRGNRVIRGNSRIGLRSAPQTDNAPDDGFSSEAYNAAYNEAHADDEYIIESETRTFDGKTVFLSAKKDRLPARKTSSDYDYYDDYGDYEDYADYYEDGNDIKKYIYKGPKREWVKLESANSKKVFWGILLGTLPITVPLASGIAVLFAAAFLALWAVIAGLILLLAVITVVGTAFSLVALIYGVTQLFSVAPIGLYEIGIGIITAGATMLSGILVYNADVRAMPYAIKYLIKFFFFTIDRIKGLVYRFREECAKIK